MSNKKDKILFFVFSIGLVIFLTSCQPTQIIYTSNEEFWEGTDGLLFSFADENPPDIVYEDTPFSIAINVENKGAHTLNSFLTLSIVDDYMCLVDENNECSTFNAVDELNPYKTKWFSLEGKSIFNYEGGSDVLEYKAKAKSAGALSEKHTVDIVATACYEYSTVWNQEVCIDTDINKMNIFPGACEVTDISLTDQGAPVAITRIESRMIPTGTGYIRPMFIIYVENKGNGKVINKEKIEHACTSTGLTYRDYNLVFLKEFILSSEELMYDFNGYNPKTGKELNPDADDDLISCSPNPIILKNDGTDTITCIVDEGLDWDMFSLNQAPYPTQISLQFDYGYTLSESKEVTIQKILY